MKVFISSTYKDLIEYRAAAIRAVEGTSYQAVKMEAFGARPDEPLDACLLEVKQSDLFIGIYALRYGFVPENSDISITEMEYIHAKKLRKPIYCFVLDQENQPWLNRWIEGEPGKSKFEAFKRRIQQDHVYEYFTTPDDLRARVANALSHYVANHLSKTPNDIAANRRRSRARTSSVYPENEIERKVRLHEFSRKLESLLEKTRETVSEEFDLFSAEFTLKLAKIVVTQFVHPSLLKWKEGELDTFHNLEETITTELSNWSSREETKAMIKADLDGWLSRVFGRITDFIYPFLNNEIFIDSKYAFNIDGYAILESLNIKLFTTTLTYVVAFITAAILLVLPGVNLLAMIVGASILGVALMQRKSWKSIHFPLRLRKTFTNKNISASLAIIEKRIHNELQKQFDTTMKPIIVAEIINEIKQQFDKQLELLKK